MKEENGIPWVKVKIYQHNVTVLEIVESINHKLDATLNFLNASLSST